MALLNTERGLTEAEYLTLERAAPFKSEFFGGEMFAMAGGTVMHSLIAANSIAQLQLNLRGRPCKAFTSDLRIKVESTGLFTYPDVSVVCGPFQVVPGTDDTIVNPTLLIEVLSDSTEAYDRGEKFRHYTQIPTLREYLLVSQRMPRVEQFVRGGNDEWTLRAAEGLNATIALPSLEITLDLKEIFAGVEFTSAPIRPQRAPPI
ncbi:MAG: Uma2 family endonuclease [Verrucomicrobia subdivision 3 bacterium]|nr:Uma2 family endonuclease [Limisphaerales bacterium]